MSQLIMGAMMVLVAYQLQLISAAAHNINPNQAPSSGPTCYDGRVCQCRSHLSEDDYKVVKRQVECLNELRVQSPFSQGSQSAITREVCQFYLEGGIRGAALRKCVFKKAGVIVNINGVDQWDLPRIREILIEHFSAPYSSPEHGGIKIIIATTFLTCPADPTNFEVFPFDDCWTTAKALISYLLEGDGNPDVESLSQDDLEFGHQDSNENDLSRILLTAKGRK